MSQPASRDQLKDWCLRQLGFPVIEINVDDDQVDDCIDMALQYFQDFHYDGTERWYAKHQITAEDIENQYIPITANLIGVTKIFAPGSLAGSSRSMFDFNYQWHLNDMQAFNAPMMTGYYITQTHLSMIDMLLIGETPIRYSRHSERLHIDWDWSVDAIEGRWIIIEGFSILDPDTYTKVWNDRMLKRLATAYVKRQWGNNLKKFEGMKLPGGISMNGQQIYNEAQQEIQEIEDLIRLTYEAPPQFIVG